MTGGPAHRVRDTRIIHSFSSSFVVHQIFIECLLFEGLQLAALTELMFYGEETGKARIRDKAEHVSRPAAPSRETAAPGSGRTACETGRGLDDLGEPGRGCAAAQSCHPGPSTRPAACPGPSGLKHACLVVGPDTCCVALGELPNLSENRYPPLSRGGDDRVGFTGQL